MSRDTHLRKALGDAAFEKVKAARVLVIGAGGIGCELLKNLVLTGFCDLEVIDLDTIDVSNLNRQFLFRPHHVGKPKAIVAREAALEFNPAAKIVAHHANIKEQERFGIRYFQGFALVINALDNVGARKHVNRQCLAANVPLIEAGTTGYLGQAYPIQKGVTACFECNPPPSGTVKYPICTIRSTPDKPVHCVVWAKELVKLLFGDAKNSHLFEDDEALAKGLGTATSGGAAGSAAAGGDDTSAGVGQARGESVYMHVVKAAPVGNPALATGAAAAATAAAVGSAAGGHPPHHETEEEEGDHHHAAAAAAAGPSAPVASASAVTPWARQLFDALFHAEITKRLTMAPETYKTAKQQPKPLCLAEIEAGTIGGETAATGGAAGAASSSSSSSASSSASGSGKLKDQQVLSLADSAALFLHALERYYSTPAETATFGTREFSKDSPLDLDLVTAATNIRAYTFGIPLQSRFDVKSIAGNIIPAIATTNAVVAGLEVLEAIKIVQGKDLAEHGRLTYVSRMPASGSLLLAPSKPDSRRADCYVCGTAGVTLFIDTHRTTLRQFIDKVLLGQLSFNSPNIDNGSMFNFIEERLEEEDDDEYEQKLAWLPLPMSSLVGGGLKDGMVITVFDFSQDLTIRITLIHRDTTAFDELKHPQFFELVGDAAAARTKAKLDAEIAKAADGAAATAAVSAAPAPATTAATSGGAVAGGKRSRAAFEEGSAVAAAPAPAAAAAAGDAADDVVLVDDGDDASSAPASTDAAAAASGPASKRARVEEPAAAAAAAVDDIVVVD